GDEFARDERPVTLVDLDHVAFVDGEVPGALGDGFNGRSPLLAARQRRHPLRARPLQDAVVHGARRVPGTLDDPRRVERLALFEHGPELQHGAPVEALFWTSDGEDPVAQLTGYADALRAFAGDEDGDVERTVGRESVGMNHLDHGPVPLDFFIAHETAQGAGVGGSVGAFVCELDARQWNRE